MSSAYADLYLKALKEPAIKKDLIFIAKTRNRFISISIPLLTFFFIVLGVTFSFFALPFTLLSISLFSISKIWAWYLAHDYAHNCGFKSKRVNTALGELASTLNGLAFFSFDEYRNHHNRHHSEKVDLIGFDVQKFKTEHPLLYKTAAFLERLYIPIFYYLIKILSVREKIKTGVRIEKMRAIAALVLYFTGYALALLYCVKAIIAWQISSVFRIHVIRFVDCFQHSFSQVQPENERIIKNDRRFEIENTFSIPVARKHTYLNLLILNFGYHSAHHSFPTCPWYMLPTLETRIIQGIDAEADSSCLRERSLNFLDLLKLYHNHHLERIANDIEGSPYDLHGNFKIEKFTGAYTDKLLG